MSLYKLTHYMMQYLCDILCYDAILCRKKLCGTSYNDAICAANDNASVNIVTQKCHIFCVTVKKSDVKFAWALFATAAFMTQNMPQKGFYGISHTYCDTFVVPLKVKFLVVKFC